VLDWEDELPAVDMRKAEINSAKCDLSICLGSSLQIVPAATLPLKAKKNGGRIVICNLQPTKYDKQADVVIHYRVDEIMTQLVKKLEISLPSPPPSLLLPTFTKEHIT
jgi:mono-ADP-ribosyltransferase sirtuin 6